MAVLDPRLLAGREIETLEKAGLTTLGRRSSAGEILDGSSGQHLALGVPSAMTGQIVIEMNGAAALPMHFQFASGKILYLIGPASLCRSLAARTRTGLAVSRAARRMP